MQESFEIKSSAGSYGVTIGSGLLDRVRREHPDALYLVDAFLADAVQVPADRLMSLVATEQAKTLERMPEVIVALRKMGANRSSHLVAVGGGVIQDVATFAASVYMRGIPWTYMPTTLLGMADSCIGGKSSINVAGYKNLIGNFYPPGKVLVDIDFARSLSEEQIVGGLFEAGKICYAKGAAEFAGYLACQPGPRMAPEQIRKAVSGALLAKKWFIEIDEFDQKERLLLNFGHTFGHALEAGTDFGVSHGIAVGFGMIVAARYASLQATLSPAGKERVAGLIDHVQALFQSLAATLVPPAAIDLARVLEKFDNDKKHRADRYRMVCPCGEGGLELIAEPRDAETRARIVEAFRMALADIGWSGRIS